MPKLRKISGKDAVKFFEKEGFVFYRQKGSHIVLTKAVEDRKEILVIPNHDELDRGMTYGIFKQSREYLPEKILKKFFYTD